MRFCASICFFFDVSLFVYFTTLPYVCVPWSVCVCVCSVIIPDHQCLHIVLIRCFFDKAQFFVLFGDLLIKCSYDKSDLWFCLCRAQCY